MHRAFATALLLLLTSTPAVATPAAAAGTSLNCVIFPDEQVDVSSPVPGVIEKVLVQRSDRVERGQILATLESSVEEATIALASARAATDAELQLRRVELRYDTQHRDRLQALHATRAVSGQIREDGERAAEVARLRVRLAEDRRRDAVLERRRADAVLALKTIRSPIRGVVVQRHRTVGEYVEDQPIARIVRLDPLRVEVIAPLALFGAVHEGMQMAIRPETDPESARVATVIAVDAVADPGSGTFGVELELPNPDLDLPAGIKCKGRLLPRIAGMGAGPPPTDRVVTVDRADATVEPSPPDGPAATPDSEVVTTTPLTASAPTAGAPGACLTYEALDDEERARALARAAERLGGRALTTEVSETRATGYMVLTAPEAGPQDTLAARLREAGITDLAVIKRGVYADRISLGVYKGPHAAERRRATLAKLGFDTEVQPLARTHRAWRVELRLPAGVDPEAARDVLSREVAGSFVEPGACEPLRTAVR